MDSSKSSFGPSQSSPFNAPNEPSQPPLQQSANKNTKRGINHFSSNQHPKRKASRPFSKKSNHSNNKPSEHKSYQKNNNHHHHHSHNHAQYHNHQSKKDQNIRKGLFITKKTETVQVREFEQKIECIVCCEKSDVHCVYENCEHTHVCWKCALSLKYLMKDDACCICKKESKKIILSGIHQVDTTYEQIDKSSLVQDTRWKDVYVDHNGILERIRYLRDYRCGMCGDHYQSITELNKHLARGHQLFYCFLCLDHRKVFIGDQKLYTKKELKIHQMLGEQDEDGRLTGHPECKFCKKRYYSDDDLFKHMNKFHEQCFLCQKKGVQYQYFRDYPHLSDHFNRHHHVCPYEECLEKRFIVFYSELDLKQHILKDHTKKKLSKRDKLQFSALSLQEASNDNHMNFTEYALKLQKDRISRLNTIDNTVVRFVGEKPEYNSHTHIDFDEEEEVRKLSKKKEEEVSKPFSKGRGASNKKFVAVSSSTSYKNNEPINVTPNNGTSIQDKKTRNMMLIKKMKSILTDTRKFQDFHKTSVLFQQGGIFALDYYKIIKDAFGDQGDEILNELIEIMPERDIPKAEALRTAQKAYNSEEFKKIRNSSTDDFSLSDEKDESSVFSSSTRKKNKQVMKKKEDDANFFEESKEKDDPVPTLEKTAKAGSSTWGGVSNSLVEKNKIPSKEDDFPSLGPPSKPSTSQNKQSGSWKKGTDNIKNSSVKVIGRGSANKAKKKKGKQLGW